MTGVHSGAMPSVTTLLSATQPIILSVCWYTLLSVKLRDFMVYGAELY